MRGAYGAEAVSLCVPSIMRVNAALLWREYESSLTFSRLKLKDMSADNVRSLNVFTLAPSELYE